MLITNPGVLLTQLWGMPTMIDEFFLKSRVPGNLCTQADATAIATRIAGLSSALVGGMGMTLPPATMGRIKVSGVSIDVDNYEVEAAWMRVDGGAPVNCWILSGTINYGNNPTLTFSLECASLIDRATVPNPGDDRPLVNPNGGIGGPDLYALIDLARGTVEFTYQGAPAQQQGAGVGIPVTGSGGTGPGPVLTGPPIG